MCNKVEINYDFIEAKKESSINLVFIHGTGCNRKFLEPLAKMFEDYNCYLIDLPGHGDSKNTGYNFDNYVETICNIVNRLSNVVLIGHSLGGTLALKIASLNLKSVKGIVALNSSANWYKLDKEFMKKIRNGVIDLEYLLSASGDNDNDDVMNALKTMEPNGVSIADFLIDEYINIEDNIKDIKVPALIITGNDEVIAIPEYSEKLHEAIKDSKMQMLNGKHMSCIAQKNKVKELVCEFIEVNVLKNEEIVYV